MHRKIKVSTLLALALGAALAYEAYRATLPTIHVRGHSMEPFGIYDNATLTIYPKREPKTGDFVSFRCKNEKCPDHGLVKFLKERRGDCFWFEGREPYTDENGQTRHSVDSRTFGWVCKPDVIIRGVVEI